MTRWNEEMEEYLLTQTASSQLAIQVSDGDEEWWLPRNRVNIIEEEKHLLTHRILVEIPNWLALDKGII